MENYNIVKFLNKGSFGKIYLVEKINTKAKYALKSIKLIGINRYNKVCILNEIKILLINNNEYLLKCYDIFIHNNKLCLITEYIDGGDLDNYIKSNKNLTDDNLVKIFLEICVGINSLHNNNIIHRDIKPANILIGKNGNIKICDFGISKFLIYNKVTNTNIGTPYFMSPEQIKEQYYDYKIDVWGIGCVLYYLLFKKYPFEGNNFQQLKNNILCKNPINNLEKKDTTNIIKIKEILKEMFEKNKQKRMNLSIFLENSKELLDFYKISNINQKFSLYNFKSVPNTISDWKILIKKLYIDFDFTSNSNLLPTIFLDNKQADKPIIKTFAEIKKKNELLPFFPLPKPKISIHKERFLVDQNAKKYCNKFKNNYYDLLEKIRVEKKIKERQLRIMNRHKSIYKKQISENNKYGPKSSLQLNRTKLKPIYFKRENMKPSYKIKPWL